MNKLFLIGNLTRDPEMSETATGVAFCRLGIAVNRPYQGSDGERATDFFNITGWRGQAENCARYLKKGSKAAVSGSIQTRNYENEGRRVYVTEIAADEVQFLSTKNEDERDELDDVDFDALRPIDEDLPF